MINLEKKNVHRRVILFQNLQQRLHKNQNQTKTEFSTAGLNNCLCYHFSHHEISHQYRTLILKVEQRGIEQICKESFPI